MRVTSKAEIRLINKENTVQGVGKYKYRAI